MDWAKVVNIGFTHGYVNTPSKIIMLLLETRRGSSVGNTRSYLLQNLYVKKWRRKKDLLHHSILHYGYHSSLTWVPQSRLASGLQPFGPLAITTLYPTASLSAGSYDCLRQSRVFFIENPRSIQFYEAMRQPLLLFLNKCPKGLEIQPLPNSLIHHFSKIHFVF